MRWVLILGLVMAVCLCHYEARAEDAKAEPEPNAEPESEPAADEVGKHKGHSVEKAGQAKASTGNNPASIPWAFSVPAIIALASVAKFIL